MRGIRARVLRICDMTVDTDALVRPDGPGSGGAKTVIPCWAMLIEHPEGLVLFDTGERTCEDGSSGRERLVEQLALCGVSPEHVRLVILSHLHHDHAGNLDLFPDADVVVQRRELEVAQAEVAAGTPGSIYRREEVSGAVRWRVIDGEREILPGIRLIPAPGHTEGLQAMLLDLERPMLVTSDACYTARNFGPPARLPGLYRDASETLRSVERLRGIAGRSGAFVMFGHDAEQFSRMRHAPEFL